MSHYHSSYIPTKNVLLSARNKSGTNDIILYVTSPHKEEQHKIILISHQLQNITLSLNHNSLQTLEFLKPSPLHEYLKTI